MLEDSKTVVLSDEELTVVDAAYPAGDEASKRTPPGVLVSRPLLYLRRATLGIGLLLLIGALVSAYADRRRADAIQRQFVALKSGGVREAHGQDDPAVSDETSAFVTGAPPLDLQVTDSGGQQFARAEPVAPRAAVEHIVQNRLLEALHDYRQLATQHATEPVYSDLVRVLESRLDCRSAADGLSSPCSD